jgi:hypothetical protein
MAFELASLNGRISEEIETDLILARMFSARAGPVHVGHVCACASGSVRDGYVGCARAWDMFVVFLIGCATLTSSRFM